MTLPDERYRAVQAAKELLIEIVNPNGRWKRIPKELRLHCMHVLRHYPTDYDMKAASREAPSVFQERMDDLHKFLLKGKEANENRS